jgi:glucose-6-phosphate 1-dehydrogenase
VHYGDLWRHGRPDAPQADTRALQPASRDLLAKEFAIIGCAFNSLTTEQFRDQLTQALREFATEPIDENLWNWFLERIYLSQATSRTGYLPEAEHLLTEINHTHTARAILLLPGDGAGLFWSNSPHLGEVGLTLEEQGHWRRVIIEKPFGHDLESAQKLNKEIRRLSTKDRSIGSITISGKRQFRISSYSDSEMDCLSLSGIETTLTPSRLLRPSVSE